MIKILNLLVKITKTIKDTLTIQSALNKGKRATVTINIPEGTYYIGKALKIYEGTTLILDDKAVFLRVGRDALIKNGSSLKRYYGYEGNSHIKIRGGTFDMNGNNCPYNNTAMSIGHARNIEIDAVTFKNVVGGHAIDACGLDGVHIHHCNFLGFYDVNGNRSFSETIQLDMFVKGAFPKFGANDGTISRNVLIEHCYFGSSKEGVMHSWNRAIGSHASRLNYYYENIIIQNNIFEETKDYALTPLKGKHIIIKDNVFINCAGGIRYLGVYKGKNMHSLDGQQTGRQGGNHFDVLQNIFVECKSLDVLHIRSHKIAPHHDVNIIRNVFLGENGPIQLTAVKDVEIIQNSQLPPLNQLHVENKRITSNTKSI
ncbi:glycosyl hydrolase family 28-related protein [Staphylococcus canis]|uniref:Pectate lyase n=1 Tax=Staphylococcus canis TaxID=2724942 RepID=A0ABS0T7Q6_9STAP|nr:glycosyl hydrolase family 28-related protein [Staphylococcus canis]MBI5974761.1 pectate lyase [Staphylococcus canis]